MVAVAGAAAHGQPGRDPSAERSLAVTPPSLDGRATATAVESAHGQNGLG